MNATATIGTNDTNNMNTSGLNPAGNNLQAISGGGLLGLEVVAASGDTFPPLKAAVVEALAIIGIVRACSATDTMYHVLVHSRKSHMRNCPFRFYVTVAST